MEQLDLTGFPKKRPDQYIMFGYEGLCADLALRRFGLAPR
jgi:hypothetical protein